MRHLCVRNQLIPKKVTGNLDSGLPIYDALCVSRSLLSGRLIEYIIDDLGLLYEKWMIFNI